MQGVWFAYTCKILPLRKLKIQVCLLLFVRFIRHREPCEAKLFGQYFYLRTSKSEYIYMDTLLEIIKLTIPGLLTFLAAYFVLKTYMENQQKLEQLKMQREQQKSSLPLRLQAYERLSLFCERISLPSLLLRVRKQGMSSGELRIALLLAVQQEYEHNITQQVYVSTQLWEIIKVTRDEAVNAISIIAEKAGSKSDATELAGMLLAYVNQQEVMAVEKALIAIKKEAATRL